MEVRNTQVRTQEQADLILRNQPRFVEPCPDCESRRGHHVVTNEELDAYFLRCGSCDTEMREVDPEELED
jgi:Zn finger protein HypA/HybF involved in hydrogenase expression